MKAYFSALDAEEAMAAGEGIIAVRGEHSFSEACQRLELLIRTRNFVVFADIDFARDAKSSGLSLRPARLFVFGNPRTGTALIQAAPGAALDLPLKVLVSQDAGGAVWFSYNSPEYLGTRHGIPPSVLKNISGIGGLVTKAAGPDLLLGG